MPSRTVPSASLPQLHDLEAKKLEALKLAQQAHAVAKAKRRAAEHALAVKRWQKLGASCGAGRAWGMCSACDCST